MNCSSCNFLSQAENRFCTQCGHALFHLEHIRSHQLAGISDRGLWHSHNEDAIAVEHLEGNRSVLIVCDGVSSSTHPENASSIAATITATALQNPQSSPVDAINHAIIQAQYAVSSLGDPFPNNPPATTIVVAVIQTDSIAQTLATIGWLGDSRAYWVSQDEAKLLTQDDSWLNAIRLSGKLSETDALRSPYAHAITRWLGANADHKPSIIQFPLPQAGYLILCSDGFWNYAADPDRISELCQLPHLQPAHAIAQTLVDHALSCGGHDNISVAIYYHDPIHDPNLI